VRQFSLFGLFGQLYLSIEDIPSEWNLMLRIGSEPSAGILSLFIV
jgi:hypothetical protein